LSGNMIRSIFEEYMAIQGRVTLVQAPKIVTLKQ